MEKKCSVNHCVSLSFLQALISPEILESLCKAAIKKDVIVTVWIVSWIVISPKYKCATMPDQFTFSCNYLFNFLNDRWLGLFFKGTLNSH